MTVAQTWSADATEGAWRASAAGGGAKAWEAPMVHGTILHMPEFAGAFGRKPGAPMVKPEEDVCATW